jgi:hypothetical protein
VPGTSTPPPVSERLSDAPRLSIQISAGWVGTPESSTGTVPPHCEDMQAATIRSGGSAARSKTERAARTMAAHQSSGSCSAPPSGSSRTGVGANEWSSTVPVVDTSATLAPPVPRSTAST